VAPDLDAEAAAITAALRALAPDLTVVPVIRTSRPFYGARVGDLRATAAGWLRAHPGATPGQVADLADRLWNTGIREEQLVACFLLARDRAALAATDPRRVLAWTGLLDNWETTDQLGMNVLGPLVALDPGGRLGLLGELAGDREAALPKASSWVLRSWLGPCPEEVAAFVDANAGRLPAPAVRETRAKLATGTKRPPRRPAPAGGRP
jgi:hypothetical protein